MGLPFSTIARGLTAPLNSEGCFDLRLLGEKFRELGKRNSASTLHDFRERGERPKGKSVMCARSVRAILNGTDVAESVY